VTPDPGLAGRVEQQSPADALRAKRIAGTRSRQEVLAELRRNSEAMRRGQMPPSDDAAEQDHLPPAFAPRPSAQANTPSPMGQDAPIPPASPTPMQERPRAAFPFAAPSHEPGQDDSTVQAQNRAQESVPPQSPARQRWANNPELTQRTREHPDDLSRIKGIGDVYKQRLYRAGFYTWKQIAETDEATLRRAVSANQSSNIGAWYGQAEQLMEKHGRKDAVYTGPHPDDLTKILGIGPVGASVLYRAGICTYEQLASTSISDLATLFPVAVAGDQPDFAQWIARAEKLADQKHEDG
jgi:predicted flap endonuclease-1-like 5' DNA nuclease